MRSVSVATVANAKLPPPVAVHYQPRYIRNISLTQSVISTSMVSLSFLSWLLLSQCLVTVLLSLPGAPLNHLGPIKGTVLASFVTYLHVVINLFACVWDFSVHTSSVLLAVKLLTLPPPPFTTASTTNHQCYRQIFMQKW